MDYVIYRNENHPVEAERGEIVLVLQNTSFQGAELCAGENQTILQATADACLHRVDLTTGEIINRTT
ncbi:MAG: hypothetical protein JKY34_11925 [Kordiimonadaceae bacterium]|nr:hypothetical protein [Kordiimonadaceae bacterium]